MHIIMYYMKLHKIHHKNKHKNAYYMKMTSKCLKNRPKEVNDAAQIAYFGGLGGDWGQTRGDDGGDWGQIRGDDGSPWDALG